MATGHCSVHADCQVEGVEVQGGTVTAVGGSLIDPTDSEAEGQVQGERASRRELCRSHRNATLPSCGTDRRFYRGPEPIYSSTSGQMGRFEQEIKPWTGVTQGYCVDRWDEGLPASGLFGFSRPVVHGHALFVGTRLEAIRDLKHMALAGPLVHDEDSVGKVSLSGLSYFLGDDDRAAASRRHSRDSSGLLRGRCSGGVHGDRG